MVSGTKFPNRETSVASCCRLPTSGESFPSRTDAHRRHLRMILIVRRSILIVNIQWLAWESEPTSWSDLDSALRELRKEQGYSQESFAAACELDRTYIGGIERGERNVALRNIESIAQTLGITLAELMEGL